ncbi:MAG TPA: type II secretion system F family protein [Acidimicrobiia bacterium]|nr:type II secretion system F family protein [Acidimicrobiia bacterium]
MISLLLGMAWASLVAVPILMRAERASVVTRAGALGLPSAVGGPHAHRLRRVLRALESLTGWRRRRRATRLLQSEIVRELPITIDLLGVAIAAGYTPYLALEVATRWAAPPTARLLTGALEACRLGASFEQALDELADLQPALRPVSEALLASDRLGAPVGDSLGRLATTARADIRRRAEAHARTVPVRLLFPLVLLVLPAFVLLTVVPTVATRLGG